MHKRASITVWSHDWIGKVDYILIPCTQVMFVLHWADVSHGHCCADHVLSFPLALLFEKCLHLKKINLFLMSAGGKFTWWLTCNFLASPPTHMSNGHSFIMIVIFDNVIWNMHVQTLWKDERSKKYHPYLTPFHWIHVFSNIPKYIDFSLHLNLAQNKFWFELTWNSLKPPKEICKNRSLLQALNQTAT